jgi:hypothetical protein
MVGCLIWKGNTKDFPEKGVDFDGFKSGVVLESGAEETGNFGTISVNICLTEGNLENLCPDGRSMGLNSI